MRWPYSTRTVELSLLLAVTASVCLAQYPFVPSDAPHYSARVVKASGQVSLSKEPVGPYRYQTVNVKGNHLIPLSPGDVVQVTQTIVTGPDGHAVLKVSDGSTIEVYPNAQLVFRKNTGDWKDLLDLIIGTVRIHIEHLGNQPNPNRIMTPTAVISVRGTTFDVTVDPEDENTEVDVQEGTVQVRHALLVTDRMATLHDGESIKVYKNVPLNSGALDKSSIAKIIYQFLKDASIAMTSHGGKINIPGGGVPGETCKPGTAGCGGSAPPAPPPLPPPPPPITH